MTWTMESALRYDEGVDAGIILGRKEGRAEGRVEGEKRGIKLGRDEEKFATARRMKAMGFLDAQIVQATGLSLADIEAL